MPIQPLATITPIPNQQTVEQQLFLKKIAQLPALMKTFVDKDLTTDLAISLVDTHHLSGVQNKAMIYLEGEIIVKNIQPSKIVSYIRQHIISDDALAKKLALDFIGTLCLPMQWYIGNVEGLIKELGGDVEKYVAEAKKNYPEVYTPKTTTETSQPSATAPASVATNEPPILHHLEEKLSSNKGRAGVLLHLTNLSLQIEERVAAKTMTAEVGQELIHSLDSLSYAVNTKDLNPLEIAAIKRKILSVLTKLGHLSA